MRVTKSFFYPLFSLVLLFGLSGNLNAAEDHLEKGIAEYKSENFEEALEILKKAKDSMPDSSIASFYLGLAYKQTGNNRNAVKNLRDAINLVPSVKDAYIELIEVLYNLNEFKEAEEWIAKAEQMEIKPASVAFLKGLVFSREGRNKEAVVVFKKARDLDRSLVQASDFQIAMLYAKDRRIPEARESLKAVIAVDPTSEIASFAKEYENAIEKSLAAYKPWRFMAGVSYQYDDNVVLKPTEASAAGDITGEKDSSMIGTLRVNYSPLMHGDWFFNFQYAFYSNTYRETNSHNIITNSITLNPGLNFNNGAITFPLSYSYILLHERGYMGLASVKPALNILFSSGNVGQFSAGYSRRDMIKPPLDKDEDRDADIYSLSAGYVHAFSEEKGVFNMRYEFSRDITDGKNWDNTGNRINIGLLVPIAKKVNLTLSGEAFLQDYKNEHSIPGPPFENRKRRDWTYTGSGGIMWKIIKDLDLNLQYSHTTADSNIPVYEYKRNNYIIGIEYNF